MQLPNDDFSIEELVCDESFQQYCLGLTLENQILWDEWINNHPEKAQDIAEAKKIVHLLSARQGSRIQQLKELRVGIKQQSLLENMLTVPSSLKTAEDSRMTQEQLQPAEIKPASIYKLYIRIAAAAAVIIVGSLFFFTDYGKKELSLIQNPITARYSSGHSITSGNALRKTVILADGTLITLGRSSTIRLTENFNSGKRELWLSGEAFFDVKHDRAHPFVVHTSFNDIKVLGTTFNVKAYPHSKSMETSLIRGSVRVDSKKYSGYSVTLKPNEKLVTNDYLKTVPDRIDKIFKISPIKNEQLSQHPEEIKWVRSRMDIENEPLSVIVQKLQKWYGITIVIADEKVKDYRYSGVFENETVIKTLEALQLSYPFEFKVEQDKITISK